MITGPIENIDKALLEGLVTNAVSESKTIEYKQAIPTKADSSVGKVLARITAFANTSGGHLLLGVEAKQGVPRKLLGVETQDPDGETLRLEQLLQSRVTPRIPGISIHPVKVDERKYVLVLRVPVSWNSPHRITPSGKFYGRNSAGNYELDVEELRAAFAMSETISTRIRDFRADRLAKVQDRETPVPLAKGGCMVVHVVPSARSEHAPVSPQLRWRREPSTFDRCGQWEVGAGG